MSEKDVAAILLYGCILLFGSKFKRLIRSINHLRSIFHLERIFRFLINIKSKKTFKIIIALHNQISCFKLNLSTFTTNQNH